MDLCKYPEYISLLSDTKKRILDNYCMYSIENNKGNVDKAIYFISYDITDEHFKDIKLLFKDDIQDKFKKIRSKQMIKFDEEDMKKFFNSQKKSILLDSDCPIYKKIIQFQNIIDPSYKARMAPHIEIIKDNNANKYKEFNKLLDTIKTVSLTNFGPLNNAYVLHIGDKYHITIMYGYNHKIKNELVKQVFLTIQNN